MDPSLDAPAPRLCHLVKWPDFDGYGFNLHAEKNKPGQFIGKVDEKSPAQAAGLKCGDRIIEVNNVNIANENHKQVVERIKAVPGETKLLVVDDSADKYFKERKMVVKHTMSNVVYTKTPATKQEFESNIVNKEEKHEEKTQIEETVDTEPEDTSNDDANSCIQAAFKYEMEHKKIEENEEAKTDTKPPSLDEVNKNEVSSGNADPVIELAKFKEEITNINITPTPSPRPSPKLGAISNSSPKPSPKLGARPNPSPKPSPKPGASPKSQPAGNSTANGEAKSALNGSASGKSNQDFLNLNMSAQEMRELIASRNKNRFDPKKESMDLRKKYAIVQSM